MKLKEISQAITNHAPGISCKTQPRKHQIILHCEAFPEETIYLLSPYYQERLAKDEFDAKDMAAILIEVDRIMRYGC